MKKLVIATLFIVLFTGTVFAQYGGNPGQKSMKDHFEELTKLREQYANAYNSPLITAKEVRDFLFRVVIAIDPVITLLLIHHYEGDRLSESSLNLFMSTVLQSSEILDSLIKVPCLYVQDDKEKRASLKEFDNLRKLLDTILNDLNVQARGKRFVAKVYSEDPCKQPLIYDLSKLPDQPKVKSNPKE